ncbi:MAG: aminotransferase class V-fold PLP-dependent enzyme [Acidimicrobiia bacterium]|nr:aminotransferase class V-fold PLP-dependent enzyme [Acidimicrobiia bacterium]
MSATADRRELPPPPATSFASDNAAGVAPEVMDALTLANTPAALAYGADPWTARLQDCIRDLVGAPAETLVCWGGTGANVVALACVLQPWQAVVCAESAHVYVDECGAPARFTGAMLLPVPTADGKIRPADLEPALAWRGVEHHPQPGAVTISQVSEHGTVYTADEIAALCDAAHAAGLAVHVDGARIANAAAATATPLTRMLRDTGVDVVSLGATKNGAMYGDAVVVLRPDLAAHAAYVHKQAAQLPSKARFVAAQLLALFEGDLWLTNATHANRMAQTLAGRVRDVDGVDLVREPEANAVFARLAHDAIRELQEWSFFWDWDSAAGVVRWMTSFATTDADVDTFASGIALACGRPDPRQV